MHVCEHQPLFATYLELIHSCPFVLQGPKAGFPWLQEVLPPTNLHQHQRQHQHQCQHGHEPLSLSQHLPVPPASLPQNPRLLRPHPHLRVGTAAQAAPGVVRWVAAAWVGFLSCPASVVEAAVAVCPSVLAPVGRPHRPRLAACCLASVLGALARALGALARALGLGLVAGAC